MPISTTIANIETALNAAILGNSGGVSARMANDLRRDLEQVASADAPRFQIAPVEMSTTGDSNVQRTAITFEVTAHHFISGDDSVQLDGHIVENMNRLMLRTFWSDITGIHAVLERPAAGEMERIGNIVSFTVTVTVDLT